MVTLAHKAELAELADFDDSNDGDYPGASANGSDGSESEDEVEIDVDESDIMLAKKAKGKKGKRGAVMRDEVKEARKKLSANADSAKGGSGVPSANKRKAGGESARPHPSSTLKKSKTTHPTGLNEDWTQEDYGISDLPPRASSPSAASEHTSEDAFQFGGLGDGSDDEEVEKVKDVVTVSRPALTSSASGFSYRSLAKVESLHSSKALPPAKKRNRPSQNSLPPATLPDFLKKIVPLVHDTIAYLDPWEPLMDREIVDLWSAVFNNDYPIDCEADPDTDANRLFKIVKFNIDAQVTSYRHRFAEAAEKALESDFERRGLDPTDVAGRAAHAQFLLGPGDRRDHASTKRRFLWESFDSLDSTVTEKKGLFLGYLVVRTYDVHLAAVANIPSDCSHLRIGGRTPFGALLTAIAAVYRALFWHYNGVNECPKDKTGHFSKANWGDYYLGTSTRGGAKPILVRRATIYKAAINKLSEDDWTRINAKALQSRVRVQALPHMEDIPDEPETDEIDADLQEGSEF